MSQSNCAITLTLNKTNIDSATIESNYSTLTSESNNSNKLSKCIVTTFIGDEKLRSSNEFQTKEFSPNFMHDPKTSIFYNQHSTLVNNEPEPNIKKQHQENINETKTNKIIYSDNNLNYLNQPFENTITLFVEINKPSISSLISLSSTNILSSPSIESQSLNVSQKRKISLMPFLTKNDLISSNIGHKDPISVAQLFGEDFAFEFCNKPPSYLPFLNEYSLSLDKITHKVEKMHSLPYDSIDKMVLPENIPDSRLLSFKKMQTENLPK